MFGVATFGEVPVAGVSVSVSGHSSVLTTADGSYSVPETNPGTYSATYSKARQVALTRTTSATT